MSPNTPFTEAPHRNRSDFKNLRAVAPFLTDYIGRVIIALSCLILAKFANVGIPLALKEIIDALDISKQNIIVLPIALLLGYGALRLGSALFNELRDSIFARVRYRAMRRLSARLLDHLYSLALRFHLERQTGAISRDLDRGTRSVSTLLNYLTFSILPTIAEFALVTVILFINYEIKFLIVIFVTVIIYVGFTLAMSEWRMHFRHSMNKLDSEANSQAIDGLINYETVKYFGNEAYEVAQYDTTLNAWENDAVKSQTSMSALNFGQSIIIAVGATIIMIYASQGVVDGDLTLGDLVLINAFLLQLFIPLGFLGIIYRQTIHSLADMDLMLKLLNQEPEIKDSKNANSIELKKGEIQFKHVDFNYNENREILNDVNFSIPPGNKVAVVGPSGAGKSTLVRLLFRFYDVNNGQIMIDGQDIRDVTQASLRNIIGIVPQDTVLFNNSIYYNIGYAKPNAGKDEIIAAARMAHIHEFIETLPEGYDTVVGERGLKLSGGEKQRIAIARVVLKNPKILIFDEATSALDSKSEQAILSALKEVAMHHSTLVIAHRLSTVVDADKILVMENGRIVEQGTHQALIEKNGSYTNMWTLQQQEREENSEIQNI
ncbi:MAG: ABC transporter ATP-binding protein/permease [Gammaproteobacteria bacterium]|nr:ABC transporter ATP-binding protein/permease [Gammaproteobacteria bacterium]